MSRIMGGIHWKNEEVVKVKEDMEKIALQRHDMDEGAVGRDKKFSMADWNLKKYYSSGVSCMIQL